MMACVVRHSLILKIILKKYIAEPKTLVSLFYYVYPQLAQQLNITLVPFLLEDVALHIDLMQADGLHPNARAQAILADKIEPYLLPLLQ